MILLTSSSDKLILELSADNAPFEVQLNYVDLNLQTRKQRPGRLNHIVTTSGDFEICPGPATYGVTRAIKQLSIYNADPSITTRVRIKHAGLDTGNVIKKVTQYSVKLPPLFSIQYTTGQGFYNQGQFDQGNSQLNTDGTGDVEKFPRFVDANTVEGLTIDELKTLLGIGGIEHDPVTGEYTFNGNIIFEPASVPYVLDLGGGSIENGTIDSGLIQ